MARDNPPRSEALCLARRQNANKSISLAAAVNPATPNRRASGLLEQGGASERANEPVLKWNVTSSRPVTLVAGLPLVDINSDTEALAAKLLGAHTMPQKAAADALHVAAAALGGVKYLLTLNCKHIANAHELPRIYDLLNREGIGQMLICTPAEFLGGDSDDQETTDT